jgi:ribosome recycling factor
MDPSDRPPFAEIFEEIKRTDFVIFPNADGNAIRLSVSKVLKEEQRLKSTWPSLTSTAARGDT